MRGNRRAAPIDQRLAIVRQRCSGTGVVLGTRPAGITRALRPARQWRHRRQADLQAIDCFTGRAVGTSGCGMDTICAVGIRRALTGIQRVGRDRVGRVEFDDGRCRGRCGDVGALIAPGILVAGAIEGCAVAGSADLTAPLRRLDGRAVVDVVVGNTGVIILISPAGGRGIQSPRRWRDTCQTHGRPTRIELAGSGINAGMRRQSASGILRIGRTLGRIGRIRHQGVGVVEPHRIGGGSLTGATAEGLGVGIARAVERGIAAHRTRLAAPCRSQCRAVVDGVGLDAGVVVLKFPAAPDIRQRDDHA